MWTLLYPGQGSQHPGMGKYLFDQFPVAKKTFEEASDTLNQDMKKLCFEGSDLELALTENTQPCLLLVSTATARVLRSEFNIKVSIGAGHSVGEYAALVDAGVMSFTDAIRAVRTRGKAMQNAVPVGQGGMVAVMGLDVQEAQELCQYIETQSGATLSPANFNSPGQIVLSGSAKAIDWLKSQFKAEAIWSTPTRIKLIPLNVSAPFHCSMMKPAEDKMREFLHSIVFNEAQYPVLQNYSAEPHLDATIIKENLIHQISAPVKWWQSMEWLKKQNHSLMIECGSGRVLQGLLKKIDSEFFKVFNTNSLEDLKLIETFIGSHR